jgi:hypothetical protein
MATDETLRSSMLIAESSGRSSKLNALKTSHPSLFTSKKPRRLSGEEMEVRDQQFKP